MLLSLLLSGYLEELSRDLIGLESVVLCVAAAVLPSLSVSNYLEKFSCNLIGLP